MISERERWRGANDGGCGKTPLGANVSEAGETPKSVWCGETTFNLPACAGCWRKVTKYNVTPKVLCSTARRLRTIACGETQGKIVGNDVMI